MLASMKGKNALEFKFERKNQTVTLASKSVVTTSGGTVQINPQLLFQRLCVIATTSERFQDPHEIFK